MLNVQITINEDNGEETFYLSDEEAVELKRLTQLSRDFMGVQGEVKLFEYKLTITSAIGSTLEQMEAAVLNPEIKASGTVREIRERIDTVNKLTEQLDQLNLAILRQTN